MAQTTNYGVASDAEDRKELATELEFAEREENAQAATITWRSWVVVFATSFAIMSQVFVVTAAGSVLAFIARSFPNSAGLVGWVVQAPLLMQSVLSPIVGRLSDALGRRFLAAAPPLLACAGAVWSAKASSINQLIGGGILIGSTLSTISIVQAVPAEILPLKWRALANGFAFLGGAVGGLIGTLGAGAVTNAHPDGWRDIFWIQAALHLATAALILLVYHPKRSASPSKVRLKQLIWSLDPVGSTLFVAGATLIIMALDWAGTTYSWPDPHVAVSLSIGLALMLAFCFYEWNGRDDGLVAHVLLKNGPNFPLSIFAFAVEGWIFYSGVNSVVPEIILNLGFEDSAWHISIRQLSFNLVNLFTSIPIMLYATRFKDLRTPLLVTFGVFLVVTICYSCITPAMGKAQIAYNVLMGVGQSGPLTLITALVQFTAPHGHLSTATGLAFSARALGGAFGSAAVDAIINGKLDRSYAADVGSAAVAAGLPDGSVASLLAALSSGSASREALGSVAGATPQVVDAALSASHNVYAAAYRLGWSSIIPFVVLAWLGIWFTRGVKDLMTEVVEASIERRPEDHRSAGLLQERA